MPDVVDILTEDHREFEQLLSALREPGRRQELTPQLAALVSTHNRAEQREVYPVAGVILDAHVARAIEYHQRVHVLLARLLQCDPTSPAYPDLLDGLIGAMADQVRQEESELLPALRQYFDDERRNNLARAFLATRQEYLHHWYSGRQARRPSFAEPPPLIE